MDADVAINSFMWQNGGHSGPDHWEFEACLQLWKGKIPSLKTGDLPKITMELVDLSRKPRDLMFYPDTKPQMS